MNAYPNDCCLFLVAMIDLIHRAIGELGTDLATLNQKRISNGCLPCDSPSCAMQKFGDDANQVPPPAHTKGDLIKQATDACKGKKFKDLPKSIKISILGRAGGGCLGLGDPIDPER